MLRRPRCGAGYPGIVDWIHDSALVRASPAAESASTGRGPGQIDAAATGAESVTPRSLPLVSRIADTTARETTAVPMM